MSQNPTGPHQPSACDRTGARLDRLEPIMEVRERSAQPVKEVLMVPADELQVVMSAGWPGLEQRRLGDWLLRAGEGYTQRANSALVVGDPGLALDEALAVVTRFYAERGLPARLQVPFPYPVPHDPAPGVDTELAGLGSTASGLTEVMVAPVTGLDLPDPPDGLHLTFSEHPSRDWMASRDRSSVALRVLTAAPAHYLEARLGDELVGIGRVCCSGGWAGLSAIEVVPEHRRRGYGRAVTAALARYGAELGAHSLYLQVEHGNPAALLYRQLGLTGHHAYHYRVLPGERSFM
mgnify:CR=1 FL=1